MSLTLAAQRLIGAVRSPKEDGIVPMGACFQRTDNKVSLRMFNQRFILHVLSQKGEGINVVGLHLSKKDF